MTTEWYTLDQLIYLHYQGALRKVHENFERKNQQTQYQSSAFQNVHQYDGTLPNQVNISYTQEAKQTVLRGLQILLLNPLSKAMAEKIMNEDIFDKSNQMSTSDLLTDICVKKMTIDIFLLLEEQLAENYLLGQCPSGKSVRLMQIRNMLE